MTKATEVYIYTLSDPDSGEVRYVGKANNVSKRLATHIRDSRRSNRPVCNWVAKLVNGGKVPVITTIATCSSESWQEEERRQISLYRSNHSNLLNLADGGDQPGINIESNRRNGRKTAEKIHNDPELHKIWRIKKNAADALKWMEKNSTPERLEWFKNVMRYAAYKRPDVFGKWAAI